MLQWEASRRVVSQRGPKAVLVPIKFLLHFQSNRV